MHEDTVAVTVAVMVVVGVNVALVLGRREFVLPGLRAESTIRPRGWLEKEAVDN